MALQDEICWVSKNKGNKVDKLLLAGYKDEGGYHIAGLLDFALGGADIERKQLIKGSQKTKFWKFYLKWKRKHQKEINE